MSSFRVLIVAAIITLVASSAQALQLARVHVPAGVESRAAAFARNVSPKARAVIAREGAVQAAARTPSVSAVAAAVRGAGFNRLSQEDIDVLCFLAMAQAADDQDHDLETIMAALKSAHGRKALPAARYSAAFTISGLRDGHWQSDIDNLKSDIDSQSELGEMESMRLQMAMERMSKLMDTLSNLMKKLSSTSDQITQNIK